MPTRLPIHCSQPKLNAGQPGVEQVLEGSSGLFHLRAVGTREIINKQCLNCLIDKMRGRHTYLIGL